MHKLIGGLVTGLIFITLGPATAQEAAVYSGAEQVAFADWIEMDGRTGTFTVALGVHQLDEDGGVVTIGAVARGRCTKSKGKHFTLIVCEGRGKGKSIPFTDFSMDPAMQEAALTLRIGGYRHRVDWTGRGRAPVSGAGVSGDDRFIYASGGMYRDAKTAGKVFGRRMRSNSVWDWGEMALGGGAMVFAGAPRSAPDISFSGRRFTVTRVLRIRR